MGYEKQTFIDGKTILRAEHLEHIEDGIVANEKAIEKVNDLSSIPAMTINETDSLLTAGDITFEGFDITRTEVVNGASTGGEYSEAGTYTFSEKGYYTPSGTIGGTSSTWVHSPLLEYERVTGTIGNFSVHSSVVNIAFYSDNDMSTYLGGVGGFSGALNPQGTLGKTITKEDLNNYGWVPEGTKYVGFATDGASDTLTVTLTESTNSGEEDESDKIVKYIIKAPKTNVSDRMLHFSFDDTISSLRDLTEKSASYKSVFDQPFFKDLKSLHDSYGAVFSCYCFNQILNAEDTSVVDFRLEDVTDAYADEFAANADWLKFGFHSLNGSTNYANGTAEEVKEHYNYFIAEIVRITGSVNCIDMVVRLQNFAGNLESCQAIRDCACGVLGFLTGDYSESGNGGDVSYDNYTTSGYYLDASTAKKVANKGRYFDATEQLFFYPSNLRLDGITSANIATYMSRFNTIDRYARNQLLIMYCHENQMFRPVGINADYKKRMANVCEWAIANKYLFGFPMDKIRQAY